MKLLRKLSSEDLAGKRVLLRLDLNVSIANGVIVDDYRIKRSLPTLQFLKDVGAKTVIVSHIESEGMRSLEVVHAHLTKLFPMIFVKEYFTEVSTKMLAGLQNGTFALMENVRNNPGEKENDSEFAEKLATLGDIYVNDAFAVSHRAHASVVGVTEFLPSYAGLLFEDEVKNLSEVEHPGHPFVFILGGAKFETKLPLVEKFMGRVNTLFLAGALANNIFIRHGFNIGLSSFSKKEMDLDGIIGHPNIIIPEDVIVENAGMSSVKRPYALSDSDCIMDAGPDSLNELSKVIAKAKFILWNGPLGLYEKGYKEGTYAVARMIAESPAQSVVGGGDTLAALHELGIEDKFTFVSTGGGAMLDFLAKGTLPGIEALNKNI
ncbi:MAG: phosphoglycerate kinase [Candidatus Paceibacterota bacterium]|jgi:3-phosphoglycerate kinase